MSDTEHRFETLDLKEMSEEGEFEGYASKFGERDKGGDVVLPGAFTKSLKTAKARKSLKMLWQHDPSSPIGVWNEVREDSKGLFVKGQLILSVSKARETHELMKAGAIDGISIGYRTVKANRDDTTGFRELKELDLWEISLVTFPMLASATVSSVKGDWTKRNVERVLRDSGMPRAMAVKLIAGGWDTANTDTQGDPGDGLNDLADTIRRMNGNVARRLS